MSISNLGLDALEAIAEAGTIVLASKKLGVTQTALTQRIKSLEADIGESLFIRSRKGMKLTPEGILLYQFAQEKSQKEAGILRRLKGLETKEPQRLRISGPTFQTQQRMFKELAGLKAQFSEVYFDFTLDDGEDLIAKLKNNQTDFILTSLTPPPSLSYKRLKASKFILVGPYSWKKRPLKEVIEAESIIDFNQQDQYTVNTLKKFKLLPKDLRQRHFINNTHQMLQLVEAGLGFAVFDEKFVAAGLKDRTLARLGPDLELAVDWHLCWNNFGSELNVVFQKFIEAIS